jgi:hypothetical protein
MVAAARSGWTVNGFRLSGGSARAAGRPATRGTRATARGGGQRSKPARRSCRLPSFAPRRRWHCHRSDPPLFPKNPGNAEKLCLVSDDPARPGLAIGIGPARTVNSSVVTVAGGRPA